MGSNPAAPTNQKRPPHQRRHGGDSASLTISPKTSNHHSSTSTSHFDDGSADGSGKILDEYSTTSHSSLLTTHLVVRHQSHAGVGSARNAALDVATGEWIVFLDPDDLLSPNALSEIAKLAAAYPNEKLIRFGYKTFTDESNGKSIVDLFSPLFPDAKSAVVDISCRLSSSDYYTYAWQHAYKRELIGDTRFPSYRRGQDRVFLLQILCGEVNSLVASDAVCYFYRRRSGSAVNSRPNLQTLKDELTHRIDIIELMDSSPKEIHYRHSDWLEAYCVRDYHQQLWQRDASERRELISWFNHQLPRIRRVRDFSHQSRFALFLCRLFASIFGSRFIAFNYPLLFERLAILLFNPTRILRSFRLRLKHPTK